MIINDLIKNINNYQIKRVTNPYLFLHFYNLLTKSFNKNKPRFTLQIRFTILIKVIVYV